MKKNLLFIILGLACQLSVNATDYYTNGQSTLAGGPNRCTGWTTNPDGATGRRSVTSTNADNFFVLEGATVTIGAGSVSQEINNLTIAGGANTQLLSNNLNNDNWFAIKGTFSGTFRRTGNGIIHLNGSEAKLAIQEVDGSTNTGILKPNFLSVVTLTEDCRVFNTIDFSTQASVLLNGKHLTAYRVNINSSGSSITGGSHSSLSLITSANNTPSQIQINQSVPGVSNYLKKFTFTDVSSSGNNYVTLQGNLIVDDLAMASSGRGTYISASNAAIRINNSYQPAAMAIRSVGASVITFGGNSITQLTNQSQAMMYKTNDVVHVEEGAKISITNFTGMRSSTYEFIKGTVTGSEFVLGEVPASIVHANLLTEQSVVKLVTPAVLPVNSLDLFAKSVTDGVQLSWFTKGEQRVSRFEIERSSNGFDFYSIASPAAVGNGNHQYSFKDASPLAGHNYYRIVSVDEDGTTIQFEPVFVNFTIMANLVNVYPNPVIFSDTHVSFSAGQFQKLELTDLSGKLYEVIEVMPTANEVIIPTVNLSPGVYFVRLYGKVNSVKKFIKK